LAAARNGSRFNVPSAATTVAVKSMSQASCRPGLHNQLASLL
jgi:hypothetical protein